MAKKSPNSEDKMELAKELAEKKTKRILEKADAFEKNEHLKDPKQSIPTIRSDLSPMKDGKE